MTQAQPLSISGPAGALEACLTTPTSPTGAGVAVLCHPHPQFGGSMHDAVLQALEGALLDAGWACLRFNFRGVGASHGQFAQGVGEKEDVLAVLAAVYAGSELGPLLSSEQLQHPALLCGYSFGAAMAWQAQLSEPRALRALWLVAPPLSAMNLAIGDPSTRLHLFAGSQDSYCLPADAGAWAKALPAPAQLHVIDGADHFFSGQHAALANAAQDALTVLGQ
ncbi:MAG: alpha/beta hydrolase [Pseudomonadales bacterium]